MNDLKHWTVSRYAALAVVLILHATLFAALFMMPRIRGVPASQARAVELVLLTPVNPPKARTAPAALRRLGGDAAITIAVPVPDSPSLPMSAAAASSSMGNGSGVDWSAEARRALQAFEIRTSQLSSNKSVSGRPEDDNWLPNAQHRPGELLKTASGDWIVWIDANCYEIATAGPHEVGAALPETICRRHSGSAAQ
jgi:hypothetical protein